MPSTGSGGALSDPAPRVQIEYAADGAGTRRQLPFVMGVLADLSGTPAEPLPPVAERCFLTIDSRHFDAWMKAIGPRAVFRVPASPTGEGELNVAITFESLGDFSPAAIVRKVDALHRLLQVRMQLDLAASGKNGTAREALENALRTLAGQALPDTRLLSGAGTESIASVIAAIDQQLSEWINRILHHPDFQHLESTWRGLHYLVGHTQTDETLKIRVLNISRQELQKTLKKYKGPAWEQSPLFKKIYAEEYRRPGGEPYGCLVGDYYFDHSPPAVELLRELARIAAAGHAPFIAGASPWVMQLKSWQEAGYPRDLTNLFQRPEYAAWRSLRDSEEARYIGLTLPRFLARQPYGARTDSVEGFDFEEDVEGAGPGLYCWANSAYLMAANINRAFHRYGWCARIRGVEAGGAVEDLAIHSFPTGAVDRKCSTEIALADRRAAEWAEYGFIPLLHRKNTGLAAFSGAQSLHKPARYDDPEATANAGLAARLPYLFAVCRFAHYLKCIARDRSGSFQGRAEMQRWLQEWIAQYVDNDPLHSSEAVKACRPLAAAEVVVEDAEGHPSSYSAKFYLRPYYQLEGLTVPLRLLVSKLPSVQGGA